MASSASNPIHRCESITIVNQYTELTRIAEWLAHASETFQLPDNLVFKLDLILNEALPNIIAYAFLDDERHDIDVMLEEHADQVILEIVDDGIPFDPFARESFKKPSSLAEASPSGRGIHLIKSVTDAQEYARAEEKNRIRLSIRK